MASTKVAIIDSGGANIASLVYAFQRLDVAAELTTDAVTIEAADRVILPGVGAAPGGDHKIATAGSASEARRRRFGATRQGTLG